MIPTAPSPPALAAALRSEFAHPGYNWLTPSHPSALARWLGRLFTRFGHALAAWIGRLFAGLHLNRAATSRPQAAAMRWEWVLLALVIILIVSAVLASRRRRLRTRRPAVSPAAVAPATAKEAVTAVGDEHTPDAWWRLYQELEASGQYRLALRAAFLSCLARLGEQHWLRLRRGRTNRDYVREFQRQLALRAADAGRGAEFAQVTRAFDAAWYGNHPVDADALAGLVQLMEAAAAA